MFFLRRVPALFLVMWLAVVSAVPACAAESPRWKRLDSRYCTLLLHPSLDFSSVNRCVNIAGVPPAGELSEEDPEGALVAKLDILFNRVQEILEMHPTALRVVLRIEKDSESIRAAHHARYGFGTPAIAFYIFEINTIYATADGLNESVIAHEMAHCVVDHYFQRRPPRKLEEMIAVHVAGSIR